MRLPSRHAPLLLAAAGALGAACSTPSADTPCDGGEQCGADGAVRGGEGAADGGGEAVDGAEAGVGECEPAAEAGDAHFFARSGVCPIRIGSS